MHRFVMAELKRWTGQRRPNPRPWRLAVCLVVLSWLTAQHTTAQPAPTEPNVRTIQLRGRIAEVTLYPHGATVTRRFHLELEPGRYELTVPQLPSTASADSLRATSSGGAVIHSVSYRPTEDLAGFEAARAATQAAADDRAAAAIELEARLDVIAKQVEFLDSLSTRVAEETAKAAGKEPINLEEVGRFSAYVAQERQRLATERQTIERELTEARAALEQARADLNALIEQGPRTIPSGLMEVSVPRAVRGPIELTLTYLVDRVLWRPEYSLRAEPDHTLAEVEFDIVVSQDTGEDWENVRLKVTTERPIRPGDDLSMTPWSLDADEILPPPRVADTGVALSRSAGIPAGRRSPGVGASARRSDRANVPWAELPLATYVLDEPVTIESDGAAEYTLSVARYRQQCEFEYVAVPLLSEHAYLRGQLRNASDRHLLPGPASIFLGDDYMGEMQFPHVGPGEGYEVFFGVDSRVPVERRLHDKRVRTTGLLSDGLETIMEYRLRLINGTGHPIRIEVWDRIPVTDDDRVKITFTDLNESLSRDSVFRRRDRPLGLLRWDLTLAAEGSERLKEIRYTLIIGHKKDVQVAPLPY